MGGEGMKQEYDQTSPVYCEECGKILLRRHEDGFLEFVFGRSKKSGSVSGPAISMQITGEVKMKCFRRTCGHWNVIKS